MPGESRTHRGAPGARWPVVASIVALATIAGVTLDQPYTDVKVGLLVVATIALLIGLGALAHGRLANFDARLIVGGGAVLAIVAQAVPDLIVLEIRVFVVTFAAACSIALVAAIRRELPVRWVAALCVIAVLVVAAACMSVLGREPIGIDVVVLHEQAVEALFEGENPYTTGNVSVLETTPSGEKELIEEYTYPPINLVWYAAGEAISGDVRTGGALALVVSVALFAVIAVGRSRSGRSVGTIALAWVSFLIANQAMYLMVSNGWTEVAVLPFLFGAVLLWHRLPVTSAILLGLALASKQYFVLALPLMLVMPDPLRWRRIAVSWGTAAATLVPFLIIDARGLIDGLVVHHLTRDPRPDGLTVANLSVELPAVVAVIAALAVGLWLVRRSPETDGRFLIALGATLAIFTLLAIRGFVNSWWLVYCIVVTGLAVALSSDASEFGEAKPGDERWSESVGMRAAGAERR